jgi:acyl-CoA thioesterase-1
VIHRSKVIASTLLAALVLLAGCGGSSPATFHFPIPTATVKPTVVYVALGASDAVGVGATDPNTEGYVPRIIARLPKGTSFALNLGVDGILEHDVLAQELPEALIARPTVMTVWLVGNDFRGCTPLAQYTADLATLLTQLHDSTSAQIFVANTPDMSLLPFFKQGAFGVGSCFRGKSLGAIRSMAEEWNAAMDPIVTKHGDVLVDLFNSDLAAHPDYISSDGFHPSSAGYAVLADLFWAQITAHHAVPGV